MICCSPVIYYEVLSVLSLSRECSLELVNLGFPEL